MSRKKKQTQAVEAEQKTATPPAENALPQSDVPPPPPEEKATDETADKAEHLTDGASESDETLKDDAKELEATQTAETAETPDDKADAEGLIDPIAFEIKLKSHHPQATYGRCGYRFSKTESVEIARADLTDAQIIMLAEDPWLEFVPVVEA